MIEFTKDRPLRVFEAFAGYSAQRLALERLKRQFPEFDYVSVGISEIDKYAIKANKAIFPDVVNYGDITKIDWLQVPDFDLLTYSFPCTCISSAGRQEGLTEGSGTASSLLWECKRAVIAKHPMYLIMENVAALLSDKFRPEFLKWTSFLEKEGYSNFTKILDAQGYGTPQHRERVFCVSIRDLDARFYFPEPFPLTKRLKDILEPKVDECFYLDDERIQFLIQSILESKGEQDGRVIVNESKTGGVSATISAHYAKEKTADFCKKRDAWGLGSYVMEKQPPPKVEYLGNLLELEGKAKRRMPSPYRIYGKNGVSPTIVASTGGNLQPFIIDENNEQDGREET